MQGTDPRLRVRRLTLRDFTPSRLEAWTALEARALEPNAYLSPHFVLPALQHLDPSLRAVFLAVERDAPRGGLLALGVFTSVPASRLCPVPHLLGYCSRHSYLGGLLVDKDHAPAAFGALCDYARRRGLGWQALVLPKMRTDGPLAELLEQRARAAGATVTCTSPKTRAVLVPALAGPEALKAALGKRTKEVERNRRRLADNGPISWHCLREKLGSEPVENFLHLEHQGWKAEEKTSLRSDPADEAFFKDMVRRFDGDSRAIFTELRLGDRTISSTSNFASGGAGFAFKIGWDVEFRKAGPGILNEIEFVRAAPQTFGDLDWFDSGAQPGSYIEKLWPERREMGTLVVPLTRAAGIGLRLFAKARVVARRIRPPPDAPPAEESPAEEANG
jgi:hypothetical protein